MSGILYVVGTPIGNLSDFSPRARARVAHTTSAAPAERAASSRTTPRACHTISAVVVFLPKKSFSTATMSGGNSSAFFFSSK